MSYSSNCFIYSSLNKYRNKYSYDTIDHGHGSSLPLLTDLTPPSHQGEPCEVCPSIPKGFQDMIALQGKSGPKGEPGAPGRGEPGLPVSFHRDALVENSALTELSKSSVRLSASLVEPGSSAQHTDIVLVFKHVDQGSSSLKLKEPLFFLRTV